MPRLKSKNAAFALRLRTTLPHRDAVGPRGAAAALALAALLGCGRSTVARGPYGTACSPEPCGDSRSCIASLPGGYCTSPCDATTPCDVGGVCDDLGGLSLCLAICTGDSDCRDGYQCWRGGCRPDCTTDGECGAAPARCVAGACDGPECTTSPDCSDGLVCVASRCVAPMADAGPPPDAPGLRGIGEPCVASAECASAVCLPADRGGICSAACTDSGACTAISPFSSVCGGATVDGRTGTFCLPYVDAATSDGLPCTSDAACGSRTCAAGLCTEGCDDAADCLAAAGAGWSCSAIGWGGGTISACNWPPALGVTISEVDLGTAPISAMRITEEHRLVVPPDAVSTTLRAEHVSGDSLPMTFYQAIAPSGLEIYSINELSMLIDQHVRWIPGDDYEAIGMLVPNGSPGRAIGTESFTFTPGPYRFTVAAYERMAGDTGSMNLRLSALVKRAPGGTVGAGTLDLAIHLVGVGVTAAAARSDARVGALVARLDMLLAQVGIRVGTISYHDVGVASLAVIDSTDGPTSELAELFRQSAGRTGNVASLFLVRDINSGEDGFNTLGVAGGIPGPSGIHGSMSSGVAVAFDAATFPGTSGGRFCGHIAAHELGHFLGLFHVTERLRACGPGEMPPACVPFGSTDTISDTTRGDTSNLMHWSTSSGTNSGLTAGQGYVLLRSAVVR